MADITPIAHIETPFAEKFGVPRQSGIADCPGRIVFEKPFRDADAVRGLEGFSHIWLIWQFDRALRQGWSPTVRPPRLGGNERVGVFATRSPFRPNGLGLSAVELERVALDEPDSPVLYVRGADMVSGTPILDIKPYLSYADSYPDASGGFTGGHGIPDIGYGIVPENYNSYVVDNVSAVASRDAQRAAQQVLRTDAIPASVSAGAALHAAAQLLANCNSRAALAIFSGRTSIV